MQEVFSIRSIIGNMQRNYRLYRLLLIIFGACIFVIICLRPSQSLGQSPHGRIISGSRCRRSGMQSNCGPPYLTYVISAKADRFNFTKMNLDTRMPKFFNIIQREPALQNDSRIGPNIARGAASLLFTYIDLWRYLGSKPESEVAEEDWIFIFEDDIDIVSMDIIASFYKQSYEKWKYASPKHSLEGLIQQGMERADKDGILYLGTCSPNYTDFGSALDYSADGAFQFRRGFYFCTHAIAYKKWRVRTIWGELATYRFVHGETGTDTIARQWQMLSKTYPVSIAANIEWPTNTGHFGLFYQARGKLVSTIQT